MAYTTQYADAAQSIQLRWKNNVIPIALSSSLTSKQNVYMRPDSDVLGAVQRSLATWEKIADVRFVIVSSDKQSVSPSGKSGDGVNLITVAPSAENILLFAKDPDDVSAQTRVFYNSKGFITEADIVLNPYQQFSSDGAFGTFDLEATLTHEIGHLLGLEHSNISGATMFAHQGKNGIYSLLNFTARTLAEDDITGIRALYGASEIDDNCCGSIKGRISSNDDTASKIFEVWAEDKRSGQVAAGVLTDSNGEYQINGLMTGEYRIFLKLRGEGNASIADQELGAAIVTKGKIFGLDRKIKTHGKAFDVKYIGFNGQMSELAVPINAGKSYTLFVGGKDFNLKKMSVGFNSPFLMYVPDTLRELDYGNGLSVFSFEVIAHRKTPAGEYTFYLKDEKGETAYFVGGIAIEPFPNEFNIQHFLTAN